MALPPAAETPIHPLYDTFLRHLIAGRVEEKKGNWEYEILDGCSIENVVNRPSIICSR